MFIRTASAQIAAGSTAGYQGLKAAEAGEGNLFVGGAGEVEVLNQTNGFKCAGGESALFIANKADNCEIQLGDAGSTAISVGECNTIFGGADKDLVVALGPNALVDLGEGNDRGCVSGQGAVLKGGDGDDTLTGVTSKLNYNELQGMNLLEMLAAILSKTAPVQEA